MGIFRINNFYLKPIFVLSIFSFIFSCRQVPEKDNIVNGDVSLKINIVGIGYDNVINATTVNSENNSGGGGGGYTTL